MRRRHFLFTLGATLACRQPAGAGQTYAISQAETLIASMQDGGKVIYLRHSTTHQEQIDTGRLGDRAGQRNLSPSGIQQARALGEALRALRVPLNEILASPVFRARDTAERAFGETSVTVTMDLVADDYAGGNVRAMVDATRGLLRTPPSPGHNRVLVGHRTPLELVTGRPFPDDVLPEGAMAVFLPGGEIHLLGTVTAERVIRAAEARGALPR